MAPTEGAPLFYEFRAGNGALLHKPAPEDDQRGYGPWARGHEPVREDEPLPETLEELTGEIERLQRVRAAAEERRRHIIACSYLLQNPARLAEETAALENAVLSMRTALCVTEDRTAELVALLSREHGRD